MLRLQVQDTGVGLNAAQIEMLFQPFMQADASNARLYGGTRVGLAIATPLGKPAGSRILMTEDNPLGDPRDGRPRPSAGRLMIAPLGHLRSAR